MPPQELVHMAAPKESCFCSTWCKMYWAKVNSLHISLCCDHDFLDVSSEVPLLMLNLYFQNCKLTTYPGTDPREYQILSGKKSNILSLLHLLHFVAGPCTVWANEELCELGRHGLIFGKSPWKWHFLMMLIFTPASNTTCVPKVVKQAEGLSGSLMRPTGSSSAFCWLLSLQTVLRQPLKGSRVLPRNWETLCGSPFQPQSKD